MSKRTIIKVLPKGEELWATQEDIERWRQKLLSGQMTPQQAADTGEVEVSTFDTQPTVDDNYLTIVKIGDDSFRPTITDLEHWRDVFKEASKDPNFVIFTHPRIEIEVIRIGDVVAVESSNGPPVPPSK